MLEIVHAADRQMAKIRSLPDYGFQVFDESFVDDHQGDAGKLLSYGRHMLYEFPDLSEERLLLARVRSGERMVSLYVDRDCYELSLMDGKGTHHLDGWQWAAKLSGYTISDLEYLMGRYLAVGVGAEKRPK